MTIVVHPLAQDELRRYASGYDTAGPGVGDEMVTDFEDVIARIAAEPTHAADAGQGVRGVLMLRFPCVVCYVVRDDGSALIVGLNHRSDAARAWLIGRSRRSRLVEPGERST